MDDDIAIKVENVSKKYCKNLKRSMIYGMMDIGKNTLGMSSHSDKLRRDEFWAVDDVSFEVKKGDSSETIINNLFNANIIDSKEKFIQVVIKRKAGRKLHYGIFEIPKVVDYDTLIDILIK